MPLRGISRQRALLLVALGVGIVVRLARVARDPLMHPDGPAYLDLATSLARGELLPVLGGYFSPLYPAAVAILAATGVGLERAGRLTAVLAGGGLPPATRSPPLPRRRGARDGARAARPQDRARSLADLAARRTHRGPERGDDVDGRGRPAPGPIPGRHRGRGGAPGGVRR